MSKLDIVQSDALVHYNAYAENESRPRRAASRLRFDSTGSHAAERSACHIQLVADGSGVNGPLSADIGLSLLGIKKNLFHQGVSVPSGQVEGINLVVRNGGNGQSDAAAIVAAVGTTDSFAAVIDARTSILDSNADDSEAAMSTQVGTIDVPTGEKFGLVAAMSKGSGTSAIRVQNGNPGSTWQNIIESYRDNQKNFQIDYNGTVFLYSTQFQNGSVRLSNENGSFRVNTSAGRVDVNTFGGVELYSAGDTTSPITVQKQGGSLQILRPNNTELMAVDADGTMRVAKLTYLDAIRDPTGSQVVGLRQHGWPTQQGSLQRGSVNTNTGNVALDELARNVAALITDLRAHGLIGD